MKAFAIFSLAVLLFAAPVFSQAPGPLAPLPGPVGPTMRSLEQIDPGIPLDPLQFPATGHVITQPGSYYLIGNVTAIVATGGSSGTITLGGISTALHSLVRNCTAAQCAGDGLSAGSYSAVLDCAAHDNGADGIQTFNGAVVSRVSSTRNTGRGILLLDACALSQGTSTNNGASGISGDQACTVSRTTGSQNGTSGFVLAEYTALADGTAANNVAEGIITEFGCALRNCSAGSNGNDGFRVGTGSVVINCAALANGSAAANTAADGFELTSVVRVSHCQAQWNAGAGIRGTSFSHYFDSCTAVLNGGSTFADVVLPNNGSIVIWSRIDSITPAPSNFIGPLNDARTLKPFSNF